MIVDHTCIGVDEVGRGPLAGPVVTAAALIPKSAESKLSHLNDSKKLSKKQRESYALEIHELCEVAIVEVSISVIDDINILQATKRGMIDAIHMLHQTVGSIAETVCVDGNFVVESPIPISSLVKGDAKHLSIAAASIVAKVYRDKLMSDLALQFPQYGWDSNAGYGSKQHMAAIHEHGITPHHRKSFEPVKSLLTKAELFVKEQNYA